MNVSIKTCTRQDKGLDQTPPPELVKIANKSNIELGMLAKWVYKGSGKWMMATEAQKQAAQRSGVVSLFDSNDGYPPYHILFGNSVYEIIMKPISNTFPPKPSGWAAWFKGALEDVNSLKCVQGCGDMPTEEASTEEVSSEAATEEAEP